AVISDVSTMTPPGIDPTGATATPTPLVPTGAVPFPSATATSSVSTALTRSPTRIWSKLTTSGPALYLSRRPFDVIRVSSRLAASMPVTVAVVVNLSTTMAPSAVSIAVDSIVPWGEEQAVRVNRAADTQARAANFSSVVFIDVLNLFGDLWNGIERKKHLQSRLQTALVGLSWNWA